MRIKKLLKIVTLGVVAAGIVGCSSGPEGMYECIIDGPGISKPASKVKLLDGSWDMTFQGKWIVDDLKKIMKKEDYGNFKIIKKEDKYILNMEGKSSGKDINQNMMIFTYNEDKDTINVLEMGMQPAFDEDRKIFTTCEKVK